MCSNNRYIYIYTLVILNLVLDSPVFTILSIKYTTEHYTCLICKNEKKCRERQQEIHLRPWPTKLNVVTKYRLYLNSWCRIWAPMSFMTQVYLRIKGLDYPRITLMIELIMVLSLELDDRTPLTCEGKNVRARNTHDPRRSLRVAGSLSLARAFCPLLWSRAEISVCS